MGRYPLMTAAEAYLKRRSVKVGKSTWNNDRRTVKFFVRAMEQMRENGLIKTTNPKAIGPVEVRALLDWMRDPQAKSNNGRARGRALDPDTQVRYLSKLEGILKMYGNTVIETMREEGYQLPQKTGKKPIRAMNSVDLKAVQVAAHQVGSRSREPEGWFRAKAEFLTKVYVATGLRPSELRLTFMDDLDTRRWRIYVRNPKGGGVWAAERTVTIMPPYRQAVTDFLQEREQLLRFYGRQKAIYLIPNLRDGKDGHYSPAHFGVLKQEVSRISGVDFQLKDFRPTFATMSVEKDPNLLIDVSAQLGHSNLMTTQRYYAQISAESAGSRLEKAWDDQPVVQKEKSINADIMLGMLMKALRINSPEDLQKLLATQAEG